MFVFSQAKVGLLETRLVAPDEFKSCVALSFSNFG